MDGYQFEHSCAKILRSKGYSGVTVTKASGDQGVDIIAHKGGHKYAVQCKYYSKPVGNSAVQQVYAGAAFYGCDSCIVMTNNTFTPHAEKLANRTGVVLMPRCRGSYSSTGNIFLIILNILSLFVAYAALSTAIGEHLRIVYNTIFGILVGLSGLCGLCAWGDRSASAVTAFFYFFACVTLNIHSLIIGRYSTGLLIFFIIPFMYAFHSYKLAVADGICIDYKEYWKKKIADACNRKKEKWLPIIFPKHSTAIFFLGAFVSMYPATSVRQWLCIVTLFFVAVIIPIDIITLIYHAKKSETIDTQDNLPVIPDATAESAGETDDSAEKSLGKHIKEVPECKMSDLHSIPKDFKPDYYLEDAIYFASAQRTISVNQVDNKFGVGYSRAAAIMNQMYLLGIVDQQNRTMQRTVLVSGKTDSYVVDIIAAIKKIKKKQGIHSSDEVEQFMVECNSHAELDGEQNNTVPDLTQNIRYNDKRFNDPEPDLEMAKLVSDEKVKDAAKKIISAYHSFGAEIKIHECKVLTNYIMCKVIPESGTKVQTIQALQPDVDIQIGMSTLINISFKSGYIGLFLPIKPFLISN